MARFLEILALLLVFDDSDLLGTGDAGDSASHACIIDERSADSCVLAIVDEEDFVKNDLVAFLVFDAFYRRELFDADKVAL